MRKLNPTVLALLGGVVALLLLIAYFATNRNSEQDKLTNAVTQAQTPSQAQPQPQAQSTGKRCASQATYELIKRELFRAAAQLRGSDQATYDQLADVAAIRMDNPVVESEDGSTGAVNCSGSLSLDLPPGVEIVGGRRTLVSDIDYSVDASGAVALRNADAIVGPLATLARTAPPAPQPAAPTETNMVAPVRPEANTAAPQPPRVQPAPPSAYPGRPSFACAKARKRAEISICSNSGLSALDVNMTTQYRRALDAATPAQRALLESTGGRFLAYRNRCPYRQCIADAYIRRMREIRDIMEGRWKPGAINRG